VCNAGEKTWYSLKDIFEEGVPGVNSPGRIGSLSDWRNLSYNNPVERDFAYLLMRHSSSEAEMSTHVAVDTICGEFRLAFVVDIGDAKIAFECDENGFKDDRTDEWRDAAILGAGMVDSIYRVRSQDLTDYPEDCLFLISKLEPKLFSERGLIHIDRLASAEAHRHAEYIKPDRWMHMVIYDNFRDRANDPSCIILYRNSRLIPEQSTPFWKALFAFAHERGGGRLDDLVDQWENQSGDKTG
jgi:hypothetical protein